MCTINVGICHDNDFGIAKFLKGKFFGANTCSQGSDNVDDLGVLKYFIKPCFVYIDALTFQRQHSLILTIPPLFSGATSRIPLYEEEFGSSWITFRAISEFTRHRCGVQNAFTADDFPCVTSSFTCLRRLNGFLDNLFRNTWTLFQNRYEFGSNKTLYNALNFCVSKFRFCLPFKLRFWNLNTDDCSHPLTDVFTGQIYLNIPQKVIISGISFEGTGDSTLETTFMETAFRGADIIGVGTNIFRICGVELESNFYFGVFLNAFYVNRFRMQNLFILV